MLLPDDDFTAVLAAVRALRKGGYEPWLAMSVPSAYAARSLPGTVLFAKLASNLQRSGFPESFFSTFYYVASSLSRFDATSHLLSILLIGPENGQCGNYATTPVAGCSAHFGNQPAYAPARARAAAERPGTPPRSAPRPGAAATPRPAPAASAPASAHTAPGGASTPQGPVNQTAHQLQGLVNYLLH